MTATTGYQAGTESTFCTLGYHQEDAWGVALANPQMQALRFTGETLAGTKSRQRPNEIIATREASAAVTTEESAGGTVNFGLSVGTFDDLLAAVMGGEWTNDVVQNASVFKSFLLEKGFGNGQFFQYPGSYPTACEISAQRGQFVSGSFTFACKKEANFQVSASNAAYTPAPSGRVLSPTGSVRAVLNNGSALSAPLNAITLNLSNDGAAGDYGLGSAAALGMRMGTFMASGKLEAYFKNIDLYSQFKSESLASLEIDMLDDTNHGYKFILLQAAVMNPKINAQNGPNQAVMASFDLEGNPFASGGTFRIERLFPTA